jgi:phosphoribosyl 1,2-cyclic phosphodiesterase
MKVTFWGTRGSVATPGSETLRYGGNTSCVQVTGNCGTVLVLDAGTGIRPMSRELPPEVRRVDVLLTHLHMDHIQGLGFFAPFFDPDMEVHVWGPASAAHALRARLVRYLSPPLFPVHLRDLPCRLHVHDLPHDVFEIGEFRILTNLVCHPGPTVGYRISGPDEETVAYMPDHEPLLGARRFAPEREWVSGMTVAEGAHLLIHDAQYTDDEYTSRVGWGHSSVNQAFDYARIAGVAALSPFHHDPMHGDEQIDKIFRKAIRKHKPAFPVMPAKEGDTFEVTPTGAVEVFA